MHYDIINSNSKGNSIVLENRLLLDAGVSYVRLRHYLKNIKLIFISHVHSL